MIHVSIGMVANTRDLVALADAIYGGDKDINLYALGRSTHMGLMLTQMFPDRVGKVILDGNSFRRTTRH
jgi:pimeloyl-ACP methyl ester carboxylesterase